MKSRSHFQALPIINAQLNFYGQQERICEMQKIARVKGPRKRKKRKQQKRLKRAMAKKSKFSVAY